MTGPNRQLASLDTTLAEGLRTGLHINIRSGHQKQEIPVIKCVNQFGFQEVHQSNKLLHTQMQREKQNKIIYLGLFIFQIIEFDTPSNLMANQNSRFNQLMAVLPDGGNDSMDDSLEMLTSDAWV